MRLRFVALLALLALSGCSEAFGWPGGVGPRRLMPAAGGGAPTITDSYSNTVDDGGAGNATRSFNLDFSTTVGHFGIVCMFPGGSTPGASGAVGSWSQCGGGGGAGTDAVCFTGAVTSATSTISLTGYQWQPWYATYIELTGPTAREASTAGCNPAVNYYSDSLTTPTVTPAHANGAIANFVRAGFTASSTSVTLTSAAPWAVNESHGSGANNLRLATHLSPTNGVGYASTWTQSSGSAGSWESISIAVY